MKVQMVGCSHHNSSVQMRERLAFSPQQVETALNDLRRRFPQAEAVLLSTCNRVELYTAATEAQCAPTHHDLVGFLAEFHGLQMDQVFDDLFEREGEDAVRHLFTVAASLDSMVVGEPQILAQVKQAYELAKSRESAGPLTHLAFQAAVKVARRVATETRIAEKRVSIPSVAVDFARQIFETFDDKQILVIGAGDMGAETLRYLREDGARHVTVANRNRQRADDLAAEWQGRSSAWENLDQELIAADLVVSTTGAQQPVVSLERFQKIEPARRQRPLFILDLAIPRDFDARIGDAGLNVYLYSIDDLEETCRQNRQERQNELPKAIGIVEEETARFMAELHHRATGPLIARLKAGWQQPKDDELRRLFNKLPELDDRSRAEIAQAFDRLINKLLHPPLESLREESQRGTPHGLLDALRRLFHLDG
ncbi:MAG: glutamyl-tRNA reductase [Pirellulales bacterium]